MKAGKYILAAALTGALSVGMGTSSYAAQEADLTGATTYHATLGIQTCNEQWIYRMGYYQDDEITPDMPEWKKLAIGQVGEDNYQSLRGTFSEAKITGNGTYKVVLRNGDYLRERTISQLHVATDIPNTGALKFTNMKVMVNGKTLLKYKKPPINEERQETVLMAVNYWKNGYKKLQTEAGFLPRETRNNITIKFTVSGFEKGKNDPLPTATPEVTDTPAPATKAPTRAPKKTKKTKEQFTPMERKIGIGVTVGVSIVSILGIVILVNGRKR